MTSVLIPKPPVDSAFTGSLMLNGSAIGSSSCSRRDLEQADARPSPPHVRLADRALAEHAFFGQAHGAGDGPVGVSDALDLDREAEDA